MVSYYNFPMYPKNHGANLTYTPSPSWYPGNYHHQPPNQFLGDAETPPQMYYHHPMFQSSPDWAAHENFSGPQGTLIQPGSNGGGPNGNIGVINGGHLGNSSTPGAGGGSIPHINQSGNNNGGNSDHIAEGINSLPSPPITVSGSEMSSPGAPNGSSSPQTANSRQTPPKNSFAYDWMKKPSYQSQPNPGSINNIICSAPSLDDFTPLEQCGMEFARKLNRKTRTKDKYRVVYSDHQRLELEKEFHTSRYITIRRKTELAQFLQLSERQVKIWFQNRRAKERKQAKKRDDNPNGVNSALPQHHNSSLMDIKPKLEPGYHPSLHQMGAMSMGMTTMGLHHPHHHHHPLHSHLSVPTSQVGTSSVLGI